MRAQAPGLKGTMGGSNAEARRNAVSDQDDERGSDEHGSGATPGEGGLRQVVRDRANLQDSPLAEFARFLRGMSQGGAGARAKTRARAAPEDEG